MEHETYQYLFPFEVVPKGARVLIYGAGLVGQEYLKQLLTTGFCIPVGFIDRNATQAPRLSIPVYPPEKISGLSFDYVVIALRTAIGVNSIRSLLQQYGVKNECVIFTGPRIEIPSIYFPDEGVNVISSFAFQKQCSVSFIFSVAGGLGDMIIQKKFIEEIIRLSPHCVIDIFTAHMLDFLKFLYKESPNVNLVVLNMGVRYRKYLSQYAFGMSFDGSTRWSVDFLAPNKFTENSDVLLGKLRSLKEKYEKEMSSSHIPDYVFYSRRNYRKINCYEWLSFDGIFDIKDRWVDIPSILDFPSNLDVIIRNTFITINSSAGNGGFEDKVAKMWPLKYWRTLLEILHNTYPDITVVQLGAKESFSLDGADHHIFGESFDIVSMLLKKAMLHIDIEGGLVHLASQLKTKCVVLFGPTSQAYFAYENNINIVAGACHGCCGLYSDIDRCARDMVEPECMYKITPELVMSKITEYMEQIGYGRGGLHQK